METQDIFQRTFSFLKEKFEQRRKEEDFFSEKGIEAFAEFVWEGGRRLTKMRRVLGWDSTHMKNLATALQEALGEKCAVYASDLYHLCDYYLGCEKLSKPLWKPVEIAAKQ